MALTDRLRELFWASGLGVLNAVTSRMGDERRFAAAVRVGRQAPWIAPVKWRNVVQNLAVINRFAGTQFRPERVFENFAVTLSDFLSGARPALRVEGREKAEEARRAGRGVIVLTSHLGHWELGGRVLTEWGWPATAVYQPYRSAAMQDFIQKRRVPGLSYLAVGKGAAAGVARVLERKETVALLGDWPFGEEGRAVRLCGATARLPRGPFLFSCRFGAPVLPGFVLREAPGRYVTYIDDPIWPDGRGPQAVDGMLDRTARVLEKYISRFGEQWYCFESAWKAGPR